MQTENGLTSNPFLMQHVFNHITLPKDSVLLRPIFPRQNLRPKTAALESFYHSMPHLLTTVLGTVSLNVFQMPISA